MHGSLHGSVDGCMGACVGDVVGGCKCNVKHYYWRFSISALRYIIISIGTQRCTFYENLAAPQLNDLVLTKRHSVYSGKDWCLQIEFL